MYNITHHQIKSNPIGIKNSSIVFDPKIQFKFKHVIISDSNKKMSKEFKFPEIINSNFNTDFSPIRLTKNNLPSKLIEEKIGSKDSSYHCSEQNSNNQIRFKKLVKLFPNLKEKIKKVYSNNEIREVKMIKNIEKFCNFEKKLDQKFNSNSRETIKNEIYSMRLSTNNYNFKKSLFKAIKYKKPPPKDPNEPLPFSLPVEMRKAFSSIEMDTHQVKQINNIKPYTKKIKKRDFSESFSNFNLPLVKPLFLKNILNCCETIESDNNTIIGNIKSLKTCHNRSLKRMVNQN